MPVYIEDCKQDLTVISIHKRVCVSCSVLGLCSLHRRADHTSSSSARLASVIEPLAFVSGECSSTIL